MKICIFGSGLAGATIARLHADKGHDVQMWCGDWGGNVVTDKLETPQGTYDIHVHGAHIFHTNNESVWDFVNRFADFSDYRHKVVADTMYGKVSMPFNMATFDAVFGSNSVDGHRRNIERTRTHHANPENFEQQATNAIGTFLYEALVKNYTRKQWGRECYELPADIFKRLPIRWTYDDCYFNNAKYQGITDYSKMIRRMIPDSVELVHGFGSIDDIEFVKEHCDKIYYSGSLDELFGYELGTLEYRSLRFENQIYDVEPGMSVLGNSVINDCTYEPHTRRIEHMLFSDVRGDKSMVTTEFPCDWKPGMTRYYPIGDTSNTVLHQLYLDKALQLGINPIGRLAKYKYFDMDACIADCFHVFTNSIIHLTI